MGRQCKAVRGAPSRPLESWNSSWWRGEGSGGWARNSTYVSNGWPVAMPAAPPIDPARRCEMTVESIETWGIEDELDSM